MKFKRMETYYFSRPFAIGGMNVTPTYVRVEQLQPTIPAHQHSRSSYEFHYCKSGSGKLIVGDESWSVDAGTLYVTGPGVIHAQLGAESDPIIEYCLFLDCKRLEPAASSCLNLFLQTRFWIGRDGGAICGILEQLLDENRSPGIDAVEITETLLRQFIVRMTRLYRESILASKVSHDSNLSASASYIPMIDDVFCYQCKSLTLSQLSAMLNLSVRQTQRLLRKHFDKTFSQKLTEARMAAAAQLLRNTSASVTEISERLGFSSIEYFSSVFRKFMDCSPREYRRRSGGRADAETEAPLDED